MAITKVEGLQLNEIRVTSKVRSFLERALPLARLGISVFPCDVRGKEPVMLPSGWRLSPLRHATTCEETIVQRWGGIEFADCNVGCFFPRSAQKNFVVDIDSVSACEEIVGHPLTLTGVADVQSSTPDKRHVYFSGAVPDWFWAFKTTPMRPERSASYSVFVIRIDTRSDRARFTQVALPIHG